MKNLKKLLCLAMVLTMVLALAACGGSPAPAATEAPATEAPAAEPADAPEADAPADLGLVTPGVLTVATSPDFAPYEFYAIGEDGAATLAGFEMDLAKYIADYLGLELNVIPMDFDGIAIELQNKSVDLGMAGLSPKPERAQVMDFSEIFYTGGQSFVCLKGNEDKFPDLESTNKAEYSIGAQSGSIQYDLAVENSPEANIIVLPKVTDIIADLLAGNLDGAYIETDVALQYAKNYPDMAVILSVPYEAEGSVIGVSKGNEALLKAVNEAIAECLNSGKMEEFVAKASDDSSGEIFEGLLEG